jgi:hypothetical protein
MSLRTRLQKSSGANLRRKIPTSAVDLHQSAAATLYAIR